MAFKFYKGTNPYMMVQHAKFCENKLCRIYFTGGRQTCPLESDKLIWRTLHPCEEFLTGISHQYDQITFGSITVQYKVFPIMVILCTLCTHYFRPDSGALLWLNQCYHSPFSPSHDQYYYPSVLRMSRFGVSFLTGLRTCNPQEISQ